ncbi:MAG: hypothetical protein NVSMB42_13450 [Herpetosiphon sp.]
MNVHHVAVDVTMHTTENGQHEPTTIMPHTWLRWARWCIVALMLLSIVLVLRSTPLRFTQLHTVCATDPCTGASFQGQTGQIGPAGLRRLTTYGLSLNTYAAYIVFLDMTRVAMGFGLATLLLFRITPIALYLAGSTLFYGMANPLDTLAPLGPAWAWLAGIEHTLGGTLDLTLFFYLFPDARFIPRWMRWLAIVLVVTQLPPLFFPASPLNPERWFSNAAMYMQLGWWSTGIISQLYRYRRVSNATQRIQTRWVIFGYATMVATIAALSMVQAVFPSLAQDGSLPQLVIRTCITVSLLLVPLTTGIAILRHRLFDIDLIINRTLVYALLTACVVGLYVLVVGSLGALFQARGSLGVSLVATGFVAVVLQPLRLRLQRMINHLLYGERDDPYAILTRLAQNLAATLAPDSVLPTIVATIGQTLKLPYVAIALAPIEAAESSSDEQPSTPERERIMASHGEPNGPALALPLLYQGEPMGRLICEPRAGEGFNVIDRRLLADLARQAGVVVHAVRLTNDLQRSTVALQRAREALVTAREEERRRLRRDLHDGLGPTLASMTLKLDAARNLLPVDLHRADTLLHGLTDQTQAAIADIRRLVHNLRPPALDELGLVSALREQATQHTHRGVQVTVVAPEHLPPLPAAVEVAAYRIAQEALNNVLRHSEADQCVIQILIEPLALCLDICDNGHGIQHSGTARREGGVGLHSMRERATELGGTCVIIPASPDGTCVHARLPLPPQATTQSSATHGQ